MPESDRLRAEIAALKSDLEPPAAAPAPAAPSESEQSREITRLLGELQRHLAEAIPPAEEQIAAHPLPAIGAAFLLGLLLGRASRRI
jgi:ElaB/YqjD/DUF883 family membrane-anchored ribosome-binding protein